MAVWNGCSPSRLQSLFVWSDGLLTVPGLGIESLLRVRRQPCIQLITRLPSVSSYINAKEEIIKSHIAMEGKVNNTHHDISIVMNIPLHQFKLCN